MANNGNLQEGGSIFVGQLGAGNPDVLDPYASLPARRCLELYRANHGGADWPTPAQATTAYNAALAVWDPSTGETGLADLFRQKLLALGVR